MLFSLREVVVMWSSKLFLDFSFFDDGIDGHRLSGECGKFKIVNFNMHIFHFITVKNIYCIRDSAVSTAISYYLMTGYFGSDIISGKTPGKWLSGKLLLLICRIMHIFQFIVVTYTPWANKKHVALYFWPCSRQLLTDFRHSFTATLCGQFALMWLLHISPHHDCLSTLPCEI